MVSFVSRIINQYGAVDCVRCDHINTFINGCRVALNNAGIETPIAKAHKAPVNERILATCKLMAMGRLKLTNECGTLVKAFKDAVWDDKNPDERLDNGTSDIDSLDSFEYAWGNYINSLTVRGGE